jgi:hypothetical protein
MEVASFFGMLVPDVPATQRKATEDLQWHVQIAGHPAYQVPRCWFGGFSFCGEGPRSRCYGRTAALRLIVKLCDVAEEKDDQFFSFIQVRSTGGIKFTGEI